MRSRNRMRNRRRIRKGRRRGGRELLPLEEVEVLVLVRLPALLLMILSLPLLPLLLPRPHPVLPGPGPLLPRFLLRPLRGALAIGLLHMTRTKKLNWWLNCKRKKPDERRKARKLLSKLRSGGRRGQVEGML